VATVSAPENDMLESIDLKSVAGSYSGLTSEKLEIFEV
jgi:hypothetical protein